MANFLSAFLSRMIYNLHKFFEKIIFCKKTADVSSQSHDFQGCLSQNFALEETKEHLYQVTCFFSVLKYHIFFQLTALTK